MDIISTIAYILLFLLVLAALAVIGIYSLHSKSLEWSSGLCYLRECDLISDVDLEREVRNPPWFVSLSDRIYTIQSKIGKN